MSQFIKVRNNSTGEYFWMKSADQEKLGSLEKVKVFVSMSKGCHPLKSGVVCVRGDVPTRTFLGVALSEVPSAYCNCGGWIDPDNMQCSLCGESF